MRVVAVGPNPNDRVKVYRPWTPTELCAMVNQFPKPDKNPTGFLQQLTTICHCYDPTPRDIQQLMMACFGERFEEVRQAMAIPDRDNWDQLHTQENCVIGIGTAVNAYAGRNACLSNITTCRQEDTETVEVFSRRFKVLWETNSGMGGDQGQAFQVACFVNGLLPHITKHLKLVMLNWETAPFTDVRTAALNVERQYKDKKRSVVKEVGVFYSQERAVGLLPDRGRGSFQRRGRYQSNQQQRGCTPLMRKDCCYLCGESGHWSKMCPMNNRCYVCGSLTHRARDCQNKHQNSSQPPTAPPMANFTVTNPFSGNKE